MRISSAKTSMTNRRDETNRGRSKQHVQVYMYKYTVRLSVTKCVLTYGFSHLL